VRLAIVLVVLVVLLSLPEIAGANENQAAKQRGTF